MLFSINCICEKQCLVIPRPFNPAARQPHYMIFKGKYRGWDFQFISVKAMIRLIRVRFNECPLYICNLPQLVKSSSPIESNTHRTRISSPGKTSMGGLNLQKIIIYTRKSEIIGHSLDIFFHFRH